MGMIIAICTSCEKGTEKKPVAEATLTAGFGIEGDAHAGNWHRQISLLPFQKIQDFNRLGARVNHGDFGENLIIDGMREKSLVVGTMLRSGDIVLRVTQLGKECHSHCAIFKRMGTCIMPVEGIFAEVLHGGHLKTGDEISIS